MELWFILTIASTVLGGIAAFSVKVAAARDYNSQVVVVTSAGMASVFIAFPVIYLMTETPSVLAGLIAFLSGLIASVSAILKIQALKYVDATIYFPLFKVVSPIFAIILGVVLFAESFSASEWIGLSVSIIVPLLLISRFESGRQNDLKQGLVLVCVTGFLAAVAAMFVKQSTIIQDQGVWIVLTNTLGVALGAALIFVIKNRQTNFWTSTRKYFSPGLIFLAFWRAIVITLSFGAGVYAYIYGGPLGIVYTVASLYILIPIILSIVFYNEHWNLRKVAAIILSIAALWFLQ